MIIETKQFSIECKYDVPENDLIYLAKQFDQYIGALESGYFEAEERNNKILESMKSLRVTKLVIRDYVPMFSSTSRDWYLIGEG